VLERACVRRFWGRPESFRIEAGRICSLSEEETEKLSEITAYWNIMHKIDPKWVRHAFEEALIDHGLTNSEVLRLLERAK
jgi:site-specific recombinase XerD